MLDLVLGLSAAQKQNEDGSAFFYLIEPLVWLCDAAKKLIGIIVFKSIFLQ